MKVGFGHSLVEVCLLLGHKTSGTSWYLCISFCSYAHSIDQFHAISKISAINLEDLGVLGYHATYPHLFVATFSRRWSYLVIGLQIICKTWACGMCMQIGPQSMHAVTTFTQRVLSVCKEIFFSHWFCITTSSVFSFFFFFFFTKVQTKIEVPPCSIDRHRLYMDKCAVIIMIITIAIIISPSFCP